MKSDLEKAYNMFNWSFVSNVLMEIGLPDNIFKVIMSAITPVNMAVLWKEKKGSYFAMQKGLRQGDPISLFLFVLCMEKLTHLIQDEVELGNWDCIRWFFRIM